MKRIRYFIYKLPGDKGEGIISALYTMLILTIVFFIGIDIAGYTAATWKLRNACTETLALMKIENGYDSNTESLFYDFLHSQGMDSSGVKVNGTSKHVQRGERVTMKAQAPYQLRSLRPLNQELSLDITVEMSGLAQEFIR